MRPDEEDTVHDEDNDNDYHDPDDHDEETDITTDDDVPLMLEGSQRKNRQRQPDDEVSGEKKAGMNWDDDTTAPSLLRPCLVLTSLLVIAACAMRVWMPSAMTTTATNALYPSDTGPDGSSEKCYVSTARGCDPDRPVPSLPLTTSSKDAPSVSSMRQQYHAAKERYMEQLERDYGANNVQTFFVRDHTNVSIGRYALRSASGPSSNENGDGGDSTTNSTDMGISWDRMKRKFGMKVLDGIMRWQQSSKQKSQRVPQMVPFVWATGGHSAAAGHGNLYNESYTAVLERAVQPIFASLGIHFQGRNYAMGGTASGPEVALCLESIFGLDIDALSWDFGMTDGHDVNLMELYFRHAGLHPNRPAVVALNIGGFGNRIAVSQTMEQAGLASLYAPPDVVEHIHKAIPDAMGQTEAELSAMPLFVRSFKCEGSVESGSPYCDETKWTDVSAICPWVKYRTSWHDGWKQHALIGNLLALSLLEIMDDALDELERLDATDPKARYDELRAMEDREYELLATSKVSEHVGDQMIRTRTELDQDLDVPYLFHHRAYCHTALLPAETRYLGILTETNQTGFYSYDTGLPRAAVENDAASSNDTTMRLAYQESDRQPCSLRLQMDYKDFFFVSEAQGARTLLLPNTAELDLYVQPTNGLIGFSLTGCDWGECEKGETRETGLDLGEWEMSVNGVPVTNFTKLESNVIFLRHRDGWHFASNTEGRYSIEVRILEVGMFLRFSSFIIL